MNVLITGVAGFLGANFARHLLSQGHKVSGIDNLSGGFASSIPKGVRFYKVDLRHGPLVDGVFTRERPEVVYHFAAYAAEGLSPFIRNYNYQNNVLCSVNVINSCANYDARKMVFTSSMAVYGTGNPPFTEDQMPSPEDPYGVAKHAVEQDLRLASEMFGFEYTVIRPHNVVGIYQNIWDRYRNVIGIWIRKLLRGEPLTIFGDGTQIRAFSDISFYMNPFEKLLTECHGEVINIGADRHYTINEAANVVLDVGREVGINGSIVHLEPRKEVHTAYCDHSKARRLLGFSDETDLRKTVKHMIMWAKDQPDHLVREMHYEVAKGMYSFWSNGNNTSVSTST